MFTCFFCISTVSQCKHHTQSVPVCACLCVSIFIPTQNASAIPSLDERGAPPCAAALFYAHVIFFFLSVFFLLQFLPGLGRRKCCILVLSVFYLVARLLKNLTKELFFSAYFVKIPETQHKFLHLAANGLVSFFSSGHLQPQPVRICSFIPNVMGSSNCVNKWLRGQIQRFPSILTGI